jgi:hypothetical protein
MKATLRPRYIAPERFSLPSRLRAAGYFKTDTARSPLIELHLSK